VPSCKTRLAGWQPASHVVAAEVTSTRRRLAGLKGFAHLLSL
jgi:hypothetical protein